MSNIFGCKSWRYEAGTKTIRSVPSNCWVASMNSWDGAEDHDANARLIASAPALLAELKRLVRFIEIEDAHLANFGEVESARAVIAKAQG